MNTKFLSEQLLQAEVQYYKVTAHLQRQHTSLSLGCWHRFFMSRKGNPLGKATETISVTA